MQKTPGVCVCVLTEYMLKHIHPYLSSTLKCYAAGGFGDEIPHVLLKVEVPLQDFFSPVMPRKQTPE